MRHWITSRSIRGRRPDGKTGCEEPWRCFNRNKSPAPDTTVSSVQSTACPRNQGSYVTWDNLRSMSAEKSRTINPFDTNSGEVPRNRFDARITYNSSNELRSETTAHSVQFWLVQNYPASRWFDEAKWEPENEAEPREGFIPGTTEPIGTQSHRRPNIIQTQCYILRMKGFQVWAPCSWQRLFWWFWIVSTAVPRL